MADLDRARSLQELGDLAQQAAEALAATPPPTQAGRLAEAFRLGAQRIASRIRQIDALAERCSGLTDAEFSFLYDQRRKLLAIGYWVADRRLDNSFYDLLASEARLASYVAIASGQIPFDHWFALGRRLTTARGRQVLLSWSGSMFEYLMPLLVMPGFEGTLLDQTCHAAVARQIEYGRQRGVPWGISESCYNVTDAEGTYQYRAFGVPGLGLQRGLSDDVVVSPYASVLALLVDPQRACANLRRMAEEACLGPYGFYEAIDFTPARVAEGERAAVVRAFMAHHHGMSLLALGQAVLGPRMQRRFLSNPGPAGGDPAAPGAHPQGERAHAPACAGGPGLAPGPEPGGGTGHARVHQPEHADPGSAPALQRPLPRDGLGRRRRVQPMERPGDHPLAGGPHVRVVRGLLFHRRPRRPAACWSNSFQPTLRAGRHYEAVFTPGRAEFRRQDDQVETHTEIAVSTEDDLEIRRIRLTNRSADRPVAAGHRLRGGRAGAGRDRRAAPGVQQPVRAHGARCRTTAPS